MYGNDNFSSWLLIPSIPDEFWFSSLDIYLPSSETEKYGMTNGSCPLVFCLQKSCRGFEHSYTFVLGSINDSDRMFYFISLFLVFMEIFFCL